MSVSSFVNDLPWPKLSLRGVELPAGVSVPDGALQKTDSDWQLLMRSTSEKPLSDQVASLVFLPTYPLAAASGSKKLPTYLLKP